MVIVLVQVIDTSLSMNALDFSKNKNELKTRLDVIKEVVTEFINKKNNDLFALITFGDYPVLQSPMTSTKVLFLSSWIKVMLVSMEIQRLLAMH